MSLKDINNNLKDTIHELSQKLKDEKSRDELKDQFKEILRQLKDPQYRAELAQQIKVGLNHGVEVAKQKIDESTSQARGDVQARVDGIQAAVEELYRAKFEPEFSKAREKIEIFLGRKPDVAAHARKVDEGSSENNPS